MNFEKDESVQFNFLGFIGKGEIVFLPNFDVHSNNYAPYYEVLISDIIDYGGSKSDFMKLGASILLNEEEMSKIDA